MEKELSAEEKVKIARSQYMKEYHKRRSSSLEYRLDKAKKANEWKKNNMDKAKEYEKKYWLKKFEELNNR